MSKVGQEPPPPPPAYAAAVSGVAPTPAQPPPPYGGPGTGTTTVVITGQPHAPLPGSVPYGSAVKFKESPSMVVCQHCQATVTTSTYYSVGLFTWMAAGAIIFFGFWLGCCLIPFCINGCKDVVHICPNCKREVGRYQRLEI